MSSSIKFAALVLALTVIATPAIARDGRHGHGNNNDQGRHGHDRRYDDRYRGDRHGRDYRGDRYRYDKRRVVYVPGWRRPAYRQPPRVVYRPAPRRVYRANYYPRWSPGVRYNAYGYRPTYVVNDYGYYGLRRPPSGYYWRRDDLGAFLLVAAATGIITDLILHGGY